MTDNEIVKALEICSGGGNCRDCPYDQTGCEFEKDALDLIKRQKAEIERLKEAYAVYEETTGLKWAKTEAIKEFVEKLKADASSIVAVENGRELYETKYYQISEVRLDCLVKEMTEDAK